MDSPSHPKPSKDKTLPGCLIVLLCLVRVEGSPHTPQLLTWQVFSQTGEVVWSLSGYHAPGTWWPTLTPDFCHLAAGLETWDISTVGAHEMTQNIQSPPPPLGKTWPQGCRNPRARCLLAQMDFYVCPQQRQSRALRCGGYESYFCANWGCETTGDAYWKPRSSWDLIEIHRNYSRPPLGRFDCDHGPGRWGSWSCKSATCLPLNITFTQKGKQDYTQWLKGKTWGLRWHMPWEDRGVILRIRLTSQTNSAPIGPNPVLADQRHPSDPSGPKPERLPSPNATNSPPTSTTEAAQPGTGDRLIGLIQGAYLALNGTQPDKTQDCWLCLMSSPPYYEGTAVVGNYSNHTSPPPTCTEGSSHRLTLTEVSGQGTCLGKIPPSHTLLCNSTQTLGPGAYYLAAPNGTYWACSTGLTPCVSTAVMNMSRDYCVLVQLWPRITYHTSEYFVSQFEERSQLRIRREPVTLTLALILGVGGIAAGIGTGAKALSETTQYHQLQTAMQSDIRILEESVTALEKSLKSLSEVVLQNRRGLDLLFLKEGGLCVALKEECCFYTDHTGIVRDNMAKLRQRLDQRQKFLDAQRGWFEGWFNKSPWSTTLISAIAGPVMVLIFILILGPCLLNRLTQFVKDRFSVIHAMVLTQQYQQLKQMDPELTESSE